MRKQWTLLARQMFAVNVAFWLLFFTSPQTNSDAEAPAGQATRVNAAPILLPEPASMPVIEPTTELVTAVPLFIPTPITLSPESVPATAAPFLPPPTLEPFFMLAKTLNPAPDNAPAPTLALAPPPEWLNYLNQFRQLAGLPLLVEDTELSIGSQKHSEYMVRNDNGIARSENPSNPFFSENGDRAARNGNIFATPQIDGKFDWAVNFWMSAPFHAVPLVNPQLQSVGYGDFYDDGGEVRMAAVMDVRSGVSGVESAVTYPLFFPRNGGRTWVLKHSLLEYPDLLGVCPGYDKPTGPPIILQIGSGDTTPNVTEHQFLQDEKVLASCIFDETTYVNVDAYAQESGRAILDEQDAIVIIPRAPLQFGRIYTASITVNGETYTWSFKAIPRPATTMRIDAEDELPQFIWPVTSRDIVQYYWSKHGAIDIVLPVGSPVKASAAGVVKYAGWHRDDAYGNLVVLDHGNGVLTLYAHLDSILVYRGQEVAQQELIGMSGNTGNSDMPHLHLEIILDYYRRVNPCDYLVESPVPTGDLWPGSQYERVDLDCGFVWVERTSRRPEP